MATSASMPMGSITQTITEPAAMETMHMKLSTKMTHQPHPPRAAKLKLRLDPLRALEPAKKKLSTLEAQRIMAVLVDTIKRTQLISALPHVIENLEAFSAVLGVELVEMLREHGVIMGSYNELKATAEQLLEKEQKRRSRASSASSRSSRPGSSESGHSSHSSKSQKSYISEQTDKALQNFSVVAQRLQFSCKNILRSLSRNPSAVKAILQTDIEMSTEAREMVDQMNALKDILMNKLLTTPVEETERNNYLKQVTVQERQNASVIAKLEAELQAALEDKENEIRKKNDVIRRLQADLHQIEKFSEEHIRRTKSEAEKQEAADVKNSDGKKVKLQQEIQQLKSQLQSLVTEHRENEQSLRKKKFKIETEVENWIQKYDTDMGERQDEYEEIDTVYTEEKKQLNELEERFKTLEEEYNQIMEERRIAREKREAAEREMAMTVLAATTIQAFWRSFKVRKALKSKKKKGKGKKSKK